MRATILVFLMMLPTDVVGEESPSLTRLFPPGGQRGTQVEVSFKGKLGDGDLQFWCNNPGLTWAKSDADNTLTVSIAENAASGVCYLRLVNQFGVSEVKPFVVGHIPECVEQEPNDQLNQSMAIESDPWLVNGVLEKRGDVDHYKLTIEAGATLIASVTAQRDLNSEADVTLQLTDVKGNVLMENLDYHGLDPQIVWTADASQEVTLRVFGFPANPNSTIALAGGDNFLYRLLVTKGAWCEGVLPLAVSTRQPTDLVAMGWNLQDHRLPTVAPLGSVSPESDGVNLPAESPYRLHVEGSPCSISLPTTSLPLHTIIRAETEEENSVLRIDLPAVVSGNICRINQRDLIEFAASKDSHWNFVLESRTLGYPLDAVLTIEDAESGKQLFQVDDVSRQADPIINWKAPHDGNYRLTVADINGDAFENNLYRLWLDTPHSELRATIAQTSFSGKVSEAIEIPIKVDRLLGFDQPVEFQLESPIDGLELTSMTSEPKGESSKEVKLKLTSQSPRVVSLRILGRVNNELDQTFTVSETATGIQDIWVTFR